jgi:hypothetical protein
MNTAANLLVILIFLSGLYTLLGLLCVFVERAQDLLARPYRRRITRRGTRRPIRPRRPNGPVGERPADPPLNALAHGATALPGARRAQ